MGHRTRRRTDAHKPGIRSPFRARHPGARDTNVDLLASRGAKGLNPGVDACSAAMTSLESPARLASCRAFRQVGQAAGGSKPHSDGWSRGSTGCQPRSLARAAPRLTRSAALAPVRPWVGGVVCAGSASALLGISSCNVGTAVRNWWADGCGPWDGFSHSQAKNWSASLAGWFPAAQRCGPWWHGA